ncbi:M24 family metallopeptidase [Hwanghaeella sp. LZ110]|uniref:M24 family metallopeptidase n=1 Tax=Hwanghaeella sp. LZ110 TaxID=3402810 RepID=UPI003B66D1B5
MPAPGVPAVLSAGNVDAATLIHAQVYQASKTGDYHPLGAVSKDLIDSFGVRMVTAVLAGYGDKLNADPEIYQEFSRVLRAAMDYALAHPEEAFNAVGKEYNIEPGFYDAWFSSYSEFPVLLSKDDMKAIQVLWDKCAELGLLTDVPVVERDRRWQQLRTKMKIAGINAIVLMGNDLWNGMGMINFRYLMQVGSYMGAVGLFPIEGDPVLWIGPEHMGRPYWRTLSEQEWVTDIRDRKGWSVVAAEIRDRKLDRGKIGYAVFSNTLSSAAILEGDKRSLNREFPNCAIVDASHMLTEMRLIKSEVEIDMLREAGRCARIALDAFIENARPGLTERELFSEVLKAQIVAGAEPNLHLFMSSGPVEHPVDEMWHLLHASEQPFAPVGRMLEQGDVVITEYHTKYAGYRCHTEFSAYLGPKAPDQLRRIWDVSVECLEASKEALTAGRSFQEAWRMIRRPAEKAGLDYVELGWHGMGLDSPVFPTVVYPEGRGSPAGNGAGTEDWELQEGMTMGNNIDLHDPSWKRDVGLMLADFMVVRPGRAECLVDVPTELPQVG